MCRGRCEMNDENVNAKKKPHFFCLNEGNSNETMNVCFVPFLSISPLYWPLDILQNKYNT